MTLVQRLKNYVPPPDLLAFISLLLFLAFTIWVVINVGVIALAVEAAGGRLMITEPLQQLIWQPRIGTVLFVSAAMFARVGLAVLCSYPNLRDLYHDPCDFYHLQGSAVGHAVHLVGQLWSFMTKGLTVRKRRKIYQRGFYGILGMVASSWGYNEEARQIFFGRVAHQLGLQPDEKVSALHYFSRGAERQADLADLVGPVLLYYRRDPELLRSFLDKLTDLATLDGNLPEAAQQILGQVADAFELRMRGRPKNRGTIPTEPATLSPYERLGVPQDASPQQVQRAYRQLALAYHPDRFILDGVPREMVSESARKFIEATEAYQEIRRQRAS